MGYTYKFEEFSDYVRMDVSGSWSAGEGTKEAKQLYAQAFELCRKNDVHRILAVFDMAGNLAVFDAYDLASDPAAIGMTPAIRVAVVCLDEERYKSNLFTETVAFNRGWKVKVFKDEHDAMPWLFKGRKLGDET